MAATLLDGKKLANKLRSELADEVREFIQKNQVTPCLATVIVGEDPASQVYVRYKHKACEQVGVEGKSHHLPDETTEAELLDLIHTLNQDDSVHGILVQLPLPKQINTERVLLAINPNKDVDAFHPENVGRLMQGNPRFLPCTPHGVQQLLVRNHIEIAGQHVVVVGRSDIVGKPVAMMLVQRGVGGDATVTVCHSRTKNLAAITKLADILIVAVGRAEMITGDMIKPGAVVIDVGVNRTEAGLVGDVEFKSAEQVASFISPVPGGVGPLTITMLMHNTLTAAKQIVAGS